MNLLDRAHSVQKCTLHAIAECSINSRHHLMLHNFCNITT